MGKYKHKKTHDIIHVYKLSKDRKWLFFRNKYKRIGIIRIDYLKKNYIKIQ